MYTKNLLAGRLTTKPPQELAVPKGKFLIFNLAVPRGKQQWQ